MNRKIILVLAAFLLLTLNVCAAQEIDNATFDDVVSTTSDFELLQISNDTQVLDVSNDIQVLKATENTKLTVVGATNFDVIGDYFKVKLTDMNNNALKNTKLTFKVNGKTYNINTDTSGIASLQLRLKDGSYSIVTKFAGNANYKATSLTTKVTMDNTREVENGMSNSEIQSIIDNAKANNVILFKGSSYSDINLVITKSLTLQSNVGTVLKSDSSSPVISIKGSKASLTKVKGFTIEGAGDGIYVNGADYVIIQGNDITSKGNGIVGFNTKYLNITKNDLVKNSKSGVSLAESSYSYIFNNKITGNGKNGVEVAKSSDIYIYENAIKNNGQNGIYLDGKINGKNHREGPTNIYINGNTISKNGENGIYVSKAGNNININSNSIESNTQSGISLSEIGNNKIQSNIISYNGYVGIEFGGNYVVPKNQDISYNAIVYNKEREIEARDTYYSINDSPLKIGDNWYSDGVICPKIKTNKIRFTVTQIGPNQFQASFIDSNGNLATLLPDRTLSYRVNNGKTMTLTISGGIATFTVDADDGDIIKAIVDNSRKDNIYDMDSIIPSQPVNGKTPSYNYPSIPNYQLYEDIGGNGNGNGDGSGGSANRGNGVSQQDSNSDGNSTYNQNRDPANNPNNQVNDVSQNYASDAVSQAGASESSAGDSQNPGSKSVLKQILIDEDEFFKVTGMSFIVLLMILTVTFYYRDDIKEMNSKR
ncbi:nitrous oxide reductase family maturation protein NosD [Methanobrevibacter sp.]|uniref:right-handed parallel beta-helix repeat-containing protein n=1 Tax=Methanobrevibacter sp. TaxID=66852 RepID=UPI0025D3EC67|nr:right-handed parallel beta-helix repeat-containing protein [Methanobrevibacter sp.]MBQ2665155.1 right-handed parallel beta-helix repeat-containing protein [Methanobrevibacter sp.]